MKTQQCPTNQELSDFDLGNLATKRSEEVSDHLDSCPECAERFENLEQQSDVVLQHLQADLPEEILTDDSELERLIGAAAALHDTSVAGRAETLPGSKVAGKPSVKQIVAQILSPAESEDELGRLGGYRVLEVLGIGGMGVVFKAEDPQLKRMVAIKAMLPHIVTASDTASDRFLREAQATAAIHHDNIVTIHQVGQEGDVPFLAMHLLEGESLGARLEREGLLPIAEACRIVRETATGLAAAHAKGLTHRDIKPDNLWLESGTGRVKILDFGLARATDDQQNLTQSGAVVGTPSYLAPEQALGEAVDARADLFSVGVVLYQMLTGKKPFERDNTLATLRAIDNETPASPSSIRPDVPAPLSDLAMRLLEKDPNNRFQLASELAEAIRTIEEGPAEPVAQPKVSKASPRTRNWVALAAAAASLIVLAAIVVVVLDKDGNIIAKIFGDSVEIIDDKGGNALDESDLTDTSPVDSSHHHSAAMSPLAMVQQPTKLTTNDGNVIASHTLDTVPIMGATTAAVSPDGKHVATFSDDGMIRIWDPRSRAIVQVLTGHTAGPLRRRSGSRIYVAFDGLSWNPDNHRLAAVDSSGELRVWDTETGKMLSSYQYEEAKIDAFRWSPDGSLLALRFDEPIVRVLDGEANLVSELEHPSGTPWHLAWSPNSKTLATSLNLNPFLFLWDVQSGKGRRVKCPSFIGGNVLSWSPDGKQIAACCEKQVVVCDVASGVPQQVLDEKARAVAWSLDGSELFIGLSTGKEPDDSYQIVRTETETETQRIELFKNKDWGGVPPRITSLTPLTDGQHLLVQFDADRDVDRNRLVNLDTNDVRGIGGYTNVNSFAASLDGTTCIRWGRSEVSIITDAVENDRATWAGLGFRSPVMNQIVSSPTLIGVYIESGTQRVTLVDRDSGRITERFDVGRGEPRAIDISPDETFVFAASKGQCWVMSRETDQPVANFSPMLDESTSNQIWAARYSPDGNEVAVVGTGITIHDSSDGRLKRSWKFPDPGEWAMDVAWSPDGKQLAVVTLDAVVRVYDANNGEQRAELRGLTTTVGINRIRHLTWSPQRHVSGSRWFLGRPEDEPRCPFVGEDACLGRHRPGSRLRSFPIPECHAVRRQHHTGLRDSRRTCCVRKRRDGKRTANDSGRPREQPCHSHRGRQAVAGSHRRSCQRSAIGRRHSPSHDPAESGPPRRLSKRLGGDFARRPLRRLAQRSQIPPPRHPQQERNTNPHPLRVPQRIRLAER